MKSKYNESILTEEESVLTSYGQLSQNSKLMIDDNDNWLITLSDVFSLLLIFLIMLVVMSKNTSGNVKSDSGEVHKTVLPYEEIRYKTDIVGDRLRDSIFSEISNLDLGDEVSVLATNNEITVTIKEKISFRPGEAEVLTGSKPVLENIADIIKRYPRYHVEIIGHTDDTPIQTEIYPSNWELSIARASSVLKYFMYNHKINPSRLSIKGVADQSPLVPNISPENRALNRRVEIKLKEIKA